MRTTTAFAAGLAALALLPATAHALPARIWVSTTGTDTAGCGPVGTPCRSFQYAHDNIADGGEIDVKDPGGYGTLTINKSVSVINDGVGAATIQAVGGAIAITVDPGAGKNVYLRGLSIDGAGSGFHGIFFASGSQLSVVDCTVRHFTATGIFVNVGPGSNFSIRDTTLADNGTGFLFLTLGGGARGTHGDFDNVTATGNGIGIQMYVTSGATGGANFNLNRVNASQNSNKGIWVERAGGDFMTVAIRDSRMAGNGTGLVVDRLSGFNPQVWLSNSEIVQNATGISNTTSPNSLFSFQNNMVEGNPVNISGPVPIAATPK